MNKSKVVAFVVVVCVAGLCAYQLVHADARPPAPTLRVSVPTQPISGIVAARAQHVPFVAVDLTAVGADIAVNSITVTESGPADDDAFDGILLLDGDGQPLTDDAGLDDHVVEFDDVLTIPMGTTQRIVVAANMADDLSDFDGQLAKLVVSDIQASGVINVR